MDNLDSSIDKICQDFDFDEKEKALVTLARSMQTADINQRRIISEICFIKRLEKVITNTTTSIDSFSASTRRYTTGLIVATGALVLITLVQFFFK